MRAEPYRCLRLLCAALLLCAWPMTSAIAQDAPAPAAPTPPTAAPAPAPEAGEPPAPDQDGPLQGPRKGGRAGRLLRGAAAAPPPDLTPPNVKPFETGIDYQPTSPSTRVTFNLEDADLPELVRMMSQITGRSFILPGKSRSIKATVYAPTKVTAAEAYQAFLSILELNGMALVPAGRYLKIVESGRIEGRAIPLYEGDEAVPTGDRFITRLHTVKNIASQDAVQLLERFKSADGSLTAYAPTNMLIMTDTGTNIRRMIRILEVVDVTRTGEQIWVEPVHHATASELAQRLSEIFDAAGGSKDGAPTAARPSVARRQAAAAAAAPGGAPGGTASATIGGGEVRITKIIADERTNSLIIVATESAYLRILEMLKHLDVSMAGEGKIHVHHLQHSDADEIASTLSNLVGKGGGPRAAGGAAGAEATASIFEGKVAVTAHKASNALVITSSTHDYAALKGVIELLDSERKQVFIEAVIMELNVNRSNSLGLGYHGGIPDVPTDNSLSVVGFNAGRSLGGVISPANGDFLTGLAVGVQGPTVTESQIGLSIPGFGVALHALASSGDANVLSTPHLIASDNVQAEISVGENVPLQTSAGLGSLGGLAGLSGLAGGQNAQAAGALSSLGALGALGGGGNVPRQDVGTTVQITPHLNDANEIRLEISEEISAAGAPSESGNLGVRSVSRTKAKTEVVVRDQQTVVIGGLMRDQVTTAQSKVPVLGDIPLIGALFRSTDKSKTKKNLLLFLTPYIIRTPDDLRAIYERKMRERQEFLDRYFVFSDSQYDAPIDYARTRGLVAEIMHQLGDLEAERKLLADAASRPELKHDPRAPVGSAPEAGVTIGPDGEIPAAETVMDPGAAQPPAEPQAPVLEQPTAQEQGITQ